MPSPTTPPSPTTRPTTTTMPVPTAADPTEILHRLERTTDQIVGREDLVERLGERRPLRIKFGVDLTAPDLHLGHAVNLWMMRALQDLGHTVIFLLGDTTSRIGDPTGRSATRPVLGEQQIQDNATAFLEQVTLVLRDDPEVLQIRRNSEWFADLGVPGLLHELSHLTHARLVSRDMFRARIAAGAEIGMHELLYPVLQGFDSVALESDLTIVGSDQLFNESIGRDLQVRHGQRPQTIITSTVTPGLDGGPKQSKSQGNYVALSASADEKFGKLMTLQDDLVETWARVYTELPDHRIAALGAAAERGGAAARDAKLDLAEAVVRRHDGADAAHRSRQEFLRVFSTGATPSELAPLWLPTATMTALDLVLAARPELTRSAARRLLHDGGIDWDGTRLTDPRASIEVRPGGVLRAGRRRWFRIEVAEEHGDRG